jgi:hypothetical protein
MERDFKHGLYDMWFFELQLHFDGPHTVAMPDAMLYLKYSWALNPGS